MLNNGKCKINEVPSYEFDRIKATSQQYMAEVPYSLPDFFIEEAAKAYLKGVKVKNCFLCRHRNIDAYLSSLKETKQRFCKLYKYRRNSNTAANCEEYRPDKNVCKKIIG